ncbi:MAG: hypothetical protein FJX74_25985, partial [Armatimonadetes bacterium]|nr:hypothetical protein [Armatimonadota bacterium]
MRAAAGVLGTLLLAGAGAGQMVDPAIDGLVGPFSYLAKPSGMIGGVGAGRGTQVTWDGALHTGEAELCLVTGDPPRPVAVRLKRFGGGATPLLHYSWMEGDVKLGVSAFAGAPGQDAPPANFVRLQVTRLGDEGHPASIGLALRHSGGHERIPSRMALNPDSRYAFDRGCALVDDRAVCVLPSLPPTRRYAVAGVPYTKPFTGSEHGVGPATAVLLALWDLGARQALTIDLKMPWTPLPPEAHQALQALRQADHDRQAEEIAQAWADELLRGMRVFLPESKPLETYRASLAYLLMGAEIPETGPARLHDLLRGGALPLEDAAPVAQALDLSGRPDLARGIMEGWLGGPPTTLPGEALSALIHHAWLTGDRPWAEARYEVLRAAADALAAGLDAGSVPPGGREWLAAAEALGAMGELAALVGRSEDAVLYRSRSAEALVVAERALDGAPLPVDALAAALALNRGLPDSP